MTDAPQKPEAMDFHTDLSVGEILRRTRVHYGQNLDQIGQILRIRASQLEALETGDLEQLPGRVYAIGFVRAYAEYLGLDGDKMVYLFKQQSVGRQARPDLQFPVAASDTKIPNLPMVVVGLALCLAVGIGVLSLMGGNPEEDVPSVPQSMQETSLSEAPSIIASSEPPPQPPPMFNEEAAEQSATTAAPIQRVIVIVEDNSWVEIRDAAGKILISQVLKPGDQFLVPNELGMTMSTGNAGGLTLQLDGKNLPKIGGQAQVKRNISLNPSDLLKL